jgi:phenylacetic acid degradation operon negative regulatory protein
VPVPKPSGEEEVARSRELQPRALIVTIYGLYAREVGGWLSVGSLIRLLAEVGVDEPGVRSSISRLKRRGILIAEKVDGVAGYGLSDHAREILREGDRRIFERPRAGAGDDWVLVIFSVPESEREKRHMLRSRLSWLGFGTVAAGVWIAPAHVEDEARDVLHRHGLTGYVNLFHAGYLAFGPLREQVAKWWDLASLAELYDEFEARYSPVLARWRRRRTHNDALAFADYVQALTHWRRLPFLDPGLAPELLPEDWHGTRAADVFFALQDRLAPAAHRHVELVTGAAPQGRSA